MSNIDLENLPYPMFETTEEEKMILRDVLDSTNYEHLCNRVTAYRYEPLRETCAKLLVKIRGAINSCDTLEGYFYTMPDGYNFCEHGFELRNIWIRKLLEYAGE